MRSKKSNTKFIIIESIIILLTTVCLISTYYLKVQISKNIKIDRKLSNELASKKNILYEKQEKLKKLNDEINVYNNLDESIEKIKSDYFNSIKELEDKILSGQSNRKIAYITFDDGPYYNTYKVLDILDKYDVKATFFTISMNGEYCYDNKSANCFKLYQEYVKRGHTIANHTYTHAIFSGLYSSANSFMSAINRQEEHIKNQTGGYITNITRFPGGSSTAGMLKDSIIDKLREKNYGWVDWTALDGDGGGLYSQEQAWSNLKSSLNDNIEVILFHDYNRITTEILPDVITYLRNNGYELYPLFYESNMVKK